MRVHQLATELGVASKDLIAKLRALGVEVKSHMSALEPAAVELMREAFQPAPAAPGPAAAPAAPAPKPAVPSALADELEETIWPEEDEVQRLRKRERPARPESRDRPAPPAREAPRPQPEPPARPPQLPEHETVLDGKTIRVKGAVLVKELAERLGLRPNQLIAELMSHNVLASINQRVDINVARLIAEKHGFTIEHEKRTEEHKQVLLRKRATEEQEQEDRPEDLLPRPPVVTFLGHVDHGKTSLLDRIRSSSVAAGEHGGITQHIGAYAVDVGGRQITFLDTPGHAAFTAMRARGAHLTDIAVIVIAADDGIMPQTREAISHARAARVTMMVAINKIDLPTANVERVKQQLQAENLTPEDWGGSTICCPVSALTGKGVDHLLEMILLQAEMLDLKANPNRRAHGYVIEAQLEPGQGPTVNVLVTNGTLHLGDALLCGPYCGNVRALISDRGVKVKSAGPSMAVKCLGLAGVPEAGAEFRVCANEKIARQLAAEAAQSQRKDAAPSIRKASLDDLFSQIKDSQRVELRVILKADTQGSIEAITHALREIKSEKVSLSLIHSATGNITVNDVMLASASNAVVLGFHVAKEPGVDAAARHEGVEIRLHYIIYELLDQVRDAMTGLLKPELREKIVGRAEVRAVFHVGKSLRVAGCRVVHGSVRPRFKARLKRGNEVLYEGAIVSLKHFQESVAEVREGQECGLRLDNFSDFAEGDVIELYEVEEIKQTL